MFVSFECLIFPQFIYFSVYLFFTIFFFFPVGVWGFDLMDVKKIIKVIKICMQWIPFANFNASDFGVVHVVAKIAVKIIKSIGKVDCS